MATTYYEDATASDLNKNTVSAPANSTKLLQAAAGSASSLTITLPSSGTSLDHVFITEPANPDASGGTGSQNYTATLNVTTANMNLTLPGVFVTRYNSAGVQQSSVLIGANIDVATTGVRTIGPVAANLGTFATGDRFALSLRFTNSAMSVQSVVFEVGLASGNEQLTAPWTISSGPHIIAVGQVTETDTAQPITRVKTKAIGQATETDLAQAISKKKTKAIGLVTETDLAQPIKWAPKIRRLGQATETDVPFAITAKKTKAIGQVTETDLAQAITRLKARALAQIIETDTAQPMSSGATVAVGQATETDAAFTIRRLKTKAVGLVTETQTAFAFTHAKVKAIGLATESDTALPLTANKTRTLGLPVETDAALAITARKTVAVGQATETDLALPIAVAGITVVSHDLLLKGVGP